MSKWRYEVIEKNINMDIRLVDALRNGYDHAQFTINSNYRLGELLGEDNLDNCKASIIWSGIYSDIPKIIIPDDYSGNLKGGTYGNKSYPFDVMIQRFFPAKKLGRMFPRHKQQIIYKEEM